MPISSLMPLYVITTQHIYFTRIGANLLSSQHETSRPSANLFVKYYLPAANDHVERNQNPRQIHRLNKQKHVLLLTAARHLYETWMDNNLNYSSRWITSPVANAAWQQKHSFNFTAHVYVPWTECQTRTVRSGPCLPDTRYRAQPISWDPLATVIQHTLIIASLVCKCKVI